MGPLDMRKSRRPHGPGTHQVGRGRLLRPPLCLRQSEGRPGENPHLQPRRLRPVLQPMVFTLHLLRFDVSGLACPRSFGGGCSVDESVPAAALLDRRMGPRRFVKECVAVVGVGFDEAVLRPTNLHRTDSFLQPSTRLDSPWRRGDVTVPERSRAPGFASVPCLLLEGRVTSAGGRRPGRAPAIQPRLTHEAGRCDVEVARPQR